MRSRRDSKEFRMEGSSSRYATYADCVQHRNRKILKRDGSSVKTNAVLIKDIGRMLSDSAKITNYVHEPFQQQARPAHNRIKTVSTCWCGHELPLGEGALPQP